MFFECKDEGCDKLFGSKKALNEHERTHQVNRPFKCSICKQRFIQFSSLSKHQRVHDQLKPFECEEPGCGKSFTQISNLRRHMKVHSGEKPFICHFCGKKFAAASNLKQHIQIHQKESGREGFKCIFPGCKKIYLYPASLKQHLRKHHSMEYSELIREKNIKQTGIEMRRGRKVKQRDHGRINNQAYSNSGTFSQRRSVRSQLRFSQSVGRDSDFFAQSSIRTEQFYQSKRAKLDLSCQLIKNCKHQQTALSEKPGISESNKEIEKVDYPESSCIVENTSSLGRLNHSIPCLTDGTLNDEQMQPLVNNWNAGDDQDKQLLPTYKDFKRKIMFIRDHQQLPENEDVGSKMSDTSEIDSSSQVPVSRNLVQRQKINSIFSESKPSTLSRDRSSKSQDKIDPSSRQYFMQKAFDNDKSTLKINRKSQIAPEHVWRTTDLKEQEEESDEESEQNRCLIEQDDEIHAAMQFQKVKKNKEEKKKEEPEILFASAANFRHVQNNTINSKKVQQDIIREATQKASQTQAGVQIISNLQQKIEEQHESIRMLMQMSLKNYSNGLENTQSNMETGNVMATLSAAQSIADHNKNLLMLVAQSPAVGQLNKTKINAPVLSPKKIPETNQESMTQSLMKKLLLQLQKEKSKSERDSSSGGKASSQIDQEHHLKVEEKLQRQNEKPGQQWSILSKALMIQNNEEPSEQQLVNQNKGFQSKIVDQNQPFQLVKPTSIVANTDPSNVMFKRLLASVGNQKPDEEEQSSSDFDRKNNFQRKIRDYRLKAGKSSSSRRRRQDSKEYEYDSHSEELTSKNLVLKHNMSIHSAIYYQSSSHSENEQKMEKKVNRVAKNRSPPGFKLGDVVRDDQKLCMPLTGVFLPPPPINYHGANKQQSSYRSKPKNSLFNKTTVVDHQWTDRSNFKFSGGDCGQSAFESMMFMSSNGSDETKKKGSADGFALPANVRTFSNNRNKLEKS